MAISLFLPKKSTYEFLRLYNSTLHTVFTQFSRDGNDEDTDRKYISNKNMLFLNVKEMMIVGTYILNKNMLFFNVKGMMIVGTITITMAIASYLIQNSAIK